MKSSKWDFLRPFIREELAYQLKEKGVVNKKEIAKTAIKVFELDIEVEAMRKVVSKLVNDKRHKAPKLKKKHSIHLVTPEESFLIPAPKTFSTPGLHIVSGCWHVPFQNKKLTTSFLNLLEDVKNDLAGFHLIGDFLDLNSLSNYDKGKFSAVPGLNLLKEYEEGNKVLDHIDSIIPSSVDKTYIYGNHEDRYKRYVKDMQQSKIPPQSPTKALKLNDRGYYVYEKWDQDYITLGNHLDLMHGTYYNVHCAKKHMDVFRGSVMFVHTHRIQTYIEGNTGAYNIGLMAGGLFCQGFSN